MTTRAPHQAPATRQSVARPRVDAQRCTGCGRCVAACEPHVLSLETLHWKKTAVLHAPEACTGCAACWVVCPFDAVRMLKPAVAEARPARPLR
ncbi:MAG: 4Fe-4S binding protein [Vitreoscilla sp.]|nr:4Fe-4S binding protein [Burkholderiales bacterium]MBP6337366.1 4Fe-4S binding protein [Vitreoscilla sp.]MBP6675465.1 4Fe-4S binding protein [Vitreoscilla sp.]